jgi:hypothetical protein
MDHLIYHPLSLVYVSVHFAWGLRFEDDLMEGGRYGAPHSWSDVLGKLDICMVQHNEVFTSANCLQNGWEIVCT